MDCFSTFIQEDIPYPPPDYRKHVSLSLWRPKIKDNQDMLRHQQADRLAAGPNDYHPHHPVYLYDFFLNHPAGAKIQPADSLDLINGLFTLHGLEIAPMMAAMHRHRVGYERRGERTAYDVKWLNEAVRQRIDLNTRLKRLRKDDDVEGYYDREMSRDFDRPPPRVSAGVMDDIYELKHLLVSIEEAVKRLEGLCEWLRV